MEDIQNIICIKHTQLFSDKKLVDVDSHSSSMEGEMKDKSENKKKEMVLCVV